MVGRVEDVLITEELERRPGRAPDYASENRALGVLAQEMATSPDTVLQKLTDLMIEFGWSQSAGISILDPNDATIFHWKAVSGLWAEHVGGTMPFDASPCGIVVTRDVPLLFARPHEHFLVAQVEPLIHEILLVPFYGAGQTVGTLWATAHDHERKFDAEDLRILMNLARFASAAHQMVEALAEAQQGRRELERRVAERTGELTQLNERLGASEERLRALVTATSYAIYSMGPDWTEMRRLDGRGFLADTSGPTGTWLDEYIPLDDQPEVWEAIERAIQVKGVFDLEHRVRRADGTLGWTHSRAVPLLDEAGEIREWFGAASDVTARKHAEMALRESEARLRATVDAVPQIAWTASAEGHHDYYNRRWYEYTGLSHDQSEAEGWTTAIHPGDLQRTLERWQHSVQTGEDYEIEYRFRGVDDAYRWFMARGVPVRDPPDAEYPQGKITRWFGTCTDIEDLVRAREVLACDREELEALVDARTAELMAAEESLRQAQKMEAVGQLTGGIAHDFNNMLQGILSGIDMARRQIGQGHAEGGMRFLEAAHGSAERAAGLTRRLLAFARRQRLTPRQVNADGLIAGLTDLIRRTMGPGIAVELTLRDGQGVVMCDPNELESALLNLCINARDAMPEGGRLMIHTGEVRLSTADIPHQEAAPGTYVEISIGDTGIGIAPEVMLRVFEPFFTTKPQGQGTGLGLSQVYGFVRQSGGLVRIESTSGRGTTIRLLLPLHEATATVVMAPSLPAVSSAQAQGSVLLVDDEDAVRGPAADRLRELGLLVLEARDGPDALRVLARARPDLLVTDVGLPNGMNGRQVAEVARERIPGLPVLFITGYASTTLPPGVEVIGKPFDLDTLAHRVQALLEIGRQRSDADRGA